MEKQDIKLEKIETYHLTFKTIFTIGKENIKKELIEGSYYDHDYKLVEKGKGIKNYLKFFGSNKIKYGSMEAGQGLVFMMTNDSLTADQEHNYYLR